MKRNTSVGVTQVLAAAAIVAGVAALVAGPLVRADTYAQQSAADTCLSNLRQLGLGMALYTQDADETFPSGADWRGSGSGWAQQIYPYVKSVAVYRCPSDPDPADTVSYGYNSNLVAPTATAPCPPTGVSFSEASLPAETVMLFEVVDNSAPKTPPYLLAPPAGGAAVPRGTLFDIHATGKSKAPLAGYSAAGRGTGDRAGELSGLGDANPAGKSVLRYATGPMSGSVHGSPYFTAKARHHGRAGFAFLDGHAAMLTGLSVSAGKTNPAVGSSGGAGLAANISSVGHNGLAATFSPE